MTDFSAQAWCELQTHHSKTKAKRKQTKSMKAGIERHDQLEKETHVFVPVETYSKEDRLAVRFIETIQKLRALKFGPKEANGDFLCREVLVFGNINGVWVSGIVDELRLPSSDLEGGIRIIDTKTRTLNENPSYCQKYTSRLQVNLYWYLIDEMKRMDAVALEKYLRFKCMKIDNELSSSVLVAFSQAFQSNSSGVTLLSIGSLLLKEFRAMGKLCNILEIAYEFRKTREIISRDIVQYNEKMTRSDLDWYTQYWRGERPPKAVTEDQKWKCSKCQYHKTCSQSPLYS